MKVTVIGNTDTRTIIAKQLAVLPAKVRAVIRDIDDGGTAEIFEWPRENVAAVLVEDTESQAR
ncbi:hypothetical protein [Faecalibaculum rodentium]|uniref:hypothetical protein n=1 Tax=Faecalibaculum rodentium TaxID=1702221 RepID=UPI00256F2305|nr:hypothetical protein [Faecalibaculum rodentium]